MNIKKITRFISLAALFLIPVFPLIVANQFFFPFITGKAFYFRVLVEIAFASWAIAALMDARYRPRLNALTVGVTVLALVTLAADLLGVNPIRSIWSNFERMEGWMVIVHLWMFFIASSSLFGSGETGLRLWHRWMNVSIAAAILVGCYGFAQLFGWAAIHQGSTRIDASLGNAAYMAVYMLLNAGMAAYLLFVARARGSSSVRQWLYGVLALIFSFLLFQTATRGTIIGLLGGIMLALFLYAAFGRNEPRKSRRISGGILIAIVLLGAAFWLNRNQPFIQRNDVLQRIASISWSDAQGQARNYIWPMALTGFAERPVLGWGQENFNYIFNANYNPKMWTQEQWFDRAHSVYLDWLTASGAVGLLAYLALYVLALLAIWKSGLTFAEKCVLVGLGAGYAVHNIFVFDNLASYALFFALLGFASSLRRGDPEPVLGGAREVGTEVIEYVAAPVVIIALALGIYLLNVRPIKANTSLIVALQSCAGASSGHAPDPALFDAVLSLNTYVADQETREQILQCANTVITAQQLPAQTKQDFFMLASDAIASQIAAAPKDARMYVLGGSFLTSIGQVAQAEPLLEKAHALSPGKQMIDLELATAYINDGKIDQALALLEEAYAADPTYPEAKTSYAAGLVLAGQESRAHQLFGDDPGLFETARMAQIFASAKQYVKAVLILQKLVAAAPSDTSLTVQLAQVQYQAGMIAQAVQTLLALEKYHPELKAQVEATIKQIQK